MPANSTVPEWGQGGAHTSGPGRGSRGPSATLSSQRAVGLWAKDPPYSGPRLSCLWSVWESLGLIHSAGVWPHPRGSDPVGQVWAQ